MNMKEAPSARDFRWCFYIYINHWMFCL